MNMTFGGDVKTIEDLRAETARAISILEFGGLKGNFTFHFGIHPLYPSVNGPLFGEKLPEAEPQLELPVEEKPKKEKTTKKKEQLAVGGSGPLTVMAKELEETPKTEPALTKQDIADACQKVSTKKNLDAAKAILAMFKNDKGEACRRISDVQEADYAAFVKKCEEAVK